MTKIVADGEMTFAEIGRELGISRGGAWMLYRSAISKLRKRPGAMEALRQIAEELQDSRARKEINLQKVKG